MVIICITTIINMGYIYLPRLGITTVSVTSSMCLFLFAASEIPESSTLVSCLFVVRDSKKLKN